MALAFCRLSQRVIGRVFLHHLGLRPGIGRIQQKGVWIFFYDANLREASARSIGAGPIETRKSGSEQSESATLRNSTTETLVEEFLALSSRHPISPFALKRPELFLKFPLEFRFLAAGDVLATAARTKLHHRQVLSALRDRNKFTSVAP